MKQPIILQQPKCAKCKKTLEPLFTTEKDEGDEGIPELLILFGKCDKCNVITMCNIIKTRDIPHDKNIDKLFKSEKNRGKAK